MDITGIIAIGGLTHWAQYLVADDFGKAQHRIERGFLVHDSSPQEGGLGAVGKLGLAQRRAQSAFGSNFWVDVLDRAFIAKAAPPTSRVPRGHFPISICACRPVGKFQTQNR